MTANQRISLTIRGNQKLINDAEVSLADFALDYDQSPLFLVRSAKLARH